MKIRLLPVFFIVFLWVKNTQAQSIPELIASLEIDTLFDYGPKDNRINLAFANIDHASANKYTDKQDLLDDVQEILTRFDPDHPNGRQGFMQYRNFFNVFNVWFPEPLLFEQRPSYFQTSQRVRDALFLPWADEQHGWISMIYTLKDGGGGGAGVVRERRVGDANIWGLDWATVLHEFNHTMPGVLDEYTASGEWSGYQCLEGPNTSGALSLDEVPWRKWIEPGTPIPTPYEKEYFDQIGVFEGTISGYFGCHRPTARGCYMGAGGFGEGYGQDMCAICLQRFICMAYQYVNVIEHPFPAERNIEINGPETITFSADFVTPIPNTQRYEWWLNGRLIAKNVNSVELNFSDCDAYTLELVVLDTTENVRFDPKFADRYPEPRQSRTWNINQANVSNYDLDFSSTFSGNDCSGLETGQISVSPLGGQAPYTYIYNGEEGPQDMRGLLPGDYTVAVVDNKGCGVQKEITLPASSILAANIISTWKDNGSWQLSVQTSGVDPESLRYTWSTGEQAASIEVANSGTYTVDVMNAGGCMVQASIDLAAVSVPFATTHQAIMTPAGGSDGAIYLSNSGGSTPYEIKWYQGSPQDLTSASGQGVISSGNGQIERHLPEFAFDDVVQYDVDFWAEGFTGNNYIGYDFGTPTPILFYSITSNVDVSGRDAKDWQLQGSNDGNTWETIDQVNDYIFSFRLTKELFYLDNPVSYEQYRLLITENHGDGWLAIQEVEFGGLQFQSMPEHEDKSALVNLESGYYQYRVIDQNNSLQEAEIQIMATSPAQLERVDVSQVNTRTIGASNNNGSDQFFWFRDEEGSTLLHQGPNFVPPATGNYYVRAFDPVSGLFTSALKGFAVTVADAPLVRTDSLGLHIEDPDPEATYYWYDAENAEQAVFEGISFVPAENGTFYVGKNAEIKEVSPIDPLSLPGISLWMDASDLNGDGQVDDPLPNSSAYSWNFRQGGSWGGGSWFPYRSGYQNGLGVVDFATMWYQGFDGGTDQIQSIVLAYEENDLSFPKSAPIYGLVENIPRHDDASQLFSADAPGRALNGEVMLNGASVDPLRTSNPLDFMLLSVVMTERSSAYAGASHEYWEGKIGEIIIWDRALTPAETQGIHAFLYKKWISMADLESTRVPVEWGNVSTGIDELEPSRQLLLSPNPTSGIMNIQATGIADWHCMIHDLQGRLLWQQKGSGSSLSVDLSGLRNGVYLVQLRDQSTGHILRKRVLKVKG